MIETPKLILDTLDAFLGHPSDQSLYFHMWQISPNIKIQSNTSNDWWPELWFKAEGWHHSRLHEQKFIGIWGCTIPKYDRTIVDLENWIADILYLFGSNILVKGSQNV